MKRSNKFIQILLLPLSWLYGAVMFLRNRLYHAEICRSESFALPIINVGNITVGGTGKTPHVEYIARILQEKYTVALLSRGYKRKTRGFVLADANATAATIGDEPFQMKQNLGANIIVAVDAKRRRGIKHLLKLRPDIDVILLDDAFQHRRVKAGLNILLMDINRPIYRDRLLPAGNLRESAQEKKRAEMIIVSKCPEDIKPIDIRVIIKDLKALPYQSVFFSGYRYAPLHHIADHAKTISLEDLHSYSVLLVSGIAQPAALTAYLKTKTADLQSIHYPDHHNFSPQDIRQIEKAFARSLSEAEGSNRSTVAERSRSTVAERSRSTVAERSRSIIITTEKDAARLRNHLSSFSEECAANLYVLPITVDILQEKETQFRKKILEFVKENKRIQH